MNHLWRLSLNTTVLVMTVLSSLAVPWQGGRGAGNRNAFPNTPFPHAPAVVWKSYLGKDFVNIPPSNTLIAGEMVIVAYGTYLLGLSADTGELRWEQMLPDVPFGDILLLDNQVVISYASGIITAINPADGNTIWKQRLPGGLSNGPTCSDTLLLFTSKANSIEALERKTGKHQATTDARDKLQAAPIFFGRSLILPYASGLVKRIDDNHDTHWAFQLPDAVLSLTPVTDGKSLYLSYANTIVALNPLNQNKPAIWIHYTPDRQFEPVTLDGQRLYIAGQSGRLFSIDAATGKDLWFTTTSKTKDEKTITEQQVGLPLYATPIGAPIVFGDSLLVRMESGLMGLYDKNTGAIQWLYRLKSPDSVSMPKTAYMGGPAIEGDDVYFAGMDGNVYHLSAKAPGKDPPSFDIVYPLTAEKGYITPDKLDYLGALIQDEGCGLVPTQMTMSLDGADLTKSATFDPTSGFFYYKIPAKEQFRQGMHRLVINCKDPRGNIGLLNKDFIVTTTSARERVVVAIRGEFVPKHLVVAPGTIISWRNESGNLRTIVADVKDYVKITHFSSDDIYPDGLPDGEQWVWFVPNNLEIGSTIYYHCRLKGQAGDGAHLGQGLVGVIEIGNP